MTLNKETRRTFVPVHVTFFLKICSTLKGGHRPFEEMYFIRTVLNNCHLLTDGVCANHSHEKSENDFSKLTDGHLGNRNPVTEVSDKSGRKRVSKEKSHRPSFLLPLSSLCLSIPQPHSFFFCSLAPTFFARPHI